MSRFNRHRGTGHSKWLLLLVAVVPVLSGCGAPRRLVTYPHGALPVAYEGATSYSTCLVASVAMAANYLEGKRRFTVESIVADLEATSADETKVSVLKEYMAGKGLYLWTLAGRTDDEPETGLGFWIRRQRYPVVCIINQEGLNPDFNHAVVVIGMSENLGVETADTIHYLDPSAMAPLCAAGEASFEEMWARGRHAMLIVTRPPPAPAGEPAAPGGVSPR